MFVQALSDVMEGILGAIYVSDNCALNGTEKFFGRVFKPFFDEFATFGMLARHAADAVLEMLNRLGCRQHSRVHDVESGAHSYESKSALSHSHHTALKRNSRLARKHALRVSEKHLQILTEKLKLLGTRVIVLPRNRNSPGESSSVRSGNESICLCIHGGKR